MSFAEVVNLILTGVGRELLYSSITFLVVLGLSRVWRPAPELQVLLWSLVLLRLVLPPGLALPISARAIVEWVTMIGDTSSFIEVAGPSSMPSVGMVAEVGDVELSAVKLAMIVSWIIGILVLSTVVLKRSREYARVIARAREVENADIKRIKEHWRTAFGVRRAVLVVTVDEPRSPFTCGIFRPVIFLPWAIVREANSMVLDSIIGHEMAHVRRLDYLWIRLQGVIQLLFFFHPVVWLTVTRLNAARERACDQIVLSKGAIPARSYGKSLLRVLELELDHAPGIPSLGDPKRGLAMRIQEILDTRDGVVTRPVLALITAVLFGLVLLPMASPGHGAGLENGGDKLEVELSNPLPGGRVTSAFGERTHPFTGDIDFHHGVDVKASPGTAIVAPAAAMVELATESWEGREHLGTVVVLDHGDGVKTLFAHLGKLMVETGQRLSRRQVFARVGNSGESTGPHLHFEIWWGEEAIDPVSAVYPW